ncbi:MAG TPA: hypothetical protein VFE50_22280 [Cyclobacteriaceae bacterium]|nr:hypothetical protein [Cyclobacteriaceae bacterium]
MKTTKKAAKKTNTGKAKSGDQEFPGYPKYDSSEDITRRADRIDENLDDEVLTQVKHNKEPKLSPDEGNSDATSVNESEPVTENKFDVTEEDLEALGPKDLSMDMGDDEQLKHRTRPVDFSGKDLDVPGTELDDEQEETGMEDEENNNYSLGGDGKTNLDEGQEHEGSL